MHYCYIIRRREFVNSVEHIYKIGRTTEQGLKRLLQYDNGIGFEIYGMRKVNNAFKVEKEIKEIFNRRYENMHDVIGSTESYRGEMREMISDFHDVCDKHCETLTKQEIYDMYEEHGVETLDDIIEFTMLKRYLGKESEFSIEEAIVVFDLILDGQVEDPDYGKILGDDTNLEGFTRNHMLRAKYLYSNINGLD